MRSHGSQSGTDAMNHYLIPDPFLQELLSYLSGRPYREVEVMVGALRSLQPAIQPDQPPDAPRRRDDQVYDARN